MREEIREEVVNRLKRVEGQVRGIQRLIENGEDCKKVAAQVKAARTALDAAGKLVLACFLADAIDGGEENEREALDLLIKF